MSNEPSEKLRPAHHVRLHHIGFAVTSIEERGQSFALGLEAPWDENIVLDPIQKVRVTFSKGAAARTR